LLAADESGVKIAVLHNVKFVLRFSSALEQGAEEFCDRSELQLGAPTLCLTQFCHPDLRQLLALVRGPCK